MRGVQLTREAPDPLYVQLKDSLVAEIRAGRYRSHQRLPSERELSSAFAVSRMTVRQALLDLVRDGLIYTRVGKGTFVSAPKIDQQLRTLTGFTTDVRARGGQAISRVLEAAVIPAAPEIAAILGLDAPAQVILLARLRLADGLPLALENAHLPAALCPNLLRHDFTVESLYAVLEGEYGLRLTQADQWLEAGLASPRELELLELTPPAAVLRIQRLTTAAGTPVEFVTSAYRGDRYTFRSVLQAGNVQ